MPPLNDRPSALSGLFYPAQPLVLERMLAGWLDDAPQSQFPSPKMLMVPHAGYRYSGAIAAAGFKALGEGVRRIRRVVLLGPCHRVPVRGISYPEVDAFSTPLGRVELDHESIVAVQQLPQVEASTQAHRDEHALEVQLPFLQYLLRGFKIVPLIVGGASPRAVMDVIECLWGGDETLLVISSDLSHFHSQQEALVLDQKTIRRIVDLDPTLDGEDACGAYPLNGALQAARRHDLEARLLVRGDSARESGDAASVVGYAAIGFWAPQCQSPSSLSHPS